MAAQANNSNKKYTWVPSVGKNVSNKYGAKGRYAAGHHTGTDIAAKEGAKIVWPKPVDGKVVHSGYSRDYGNYVIIKDIKTKPNATLTGEAPVKNDDSAKYLGPSRTLLAHMEHRGPKKGTILSPGEKIVGNVGNTGNSTGSHLHIEQTATAEKWAYGKNLVKPQLVYAAPNGSTVMNRLNYVLGTSGTAALQQSIINYQNSGNGIRTFGKPNTSSFRIEVKIGKDWVKNPATVFDKLRAYAPTTAGQPSNTPLPPPPTSVGTPVSVAPPVTDTGSGVAPTTPLSTDPTVDPTGSTPTDTSDPGATGTTPTDPTSDDGGSTGDTTTDNPDAGVPEAGTVDEGTDSTTTDPLETATGGAPTTPPTTDQMDNSGATDKSTLDTKRKGMVASKADLRRQERIASGANDVDLTKAAQASQTLLAADRNGDNKVSKQEQRVFNPADSNNDGKVGNKEINKYVTKVDLDKDGKVKPVEAKAFRTVDGNDDNNVSKKELKAYSAIAGSDGHASRQELKQALKAQIDSKQDQRKHDIALEALRRTNEKQGGSALVGQNSDALVAGQMAKRNNKDNDGPGKKKKNR